MSIWMFWKLFGDVCLYFSAVCALPTLLYHDFSFLLPAVLCGTGGAAASWLLLHTRYGWRWLGMVFPLLALLAAEDTMGLLILLPPVVYTGAVILRGQFLLEYLSFRSYFQKACVLWAALFLLLCLGSSAEELTRPWAAVLDVEGPLRCGVFYGISGVLLLRQLRMGADNGGRRLGAVQELGMLAGSAGVIGLLVGAQRLIERFGDDVRNFLGQALLFLSTLPVSILGWLLDQLFDDLTLIYEQTPEATGSTSETVYAVGAAAPVATPVTDTAAGASGFPWWLAVVVLAVLAAVLFAAMGLHRDKTAGSGTQAVFDRLSPPERSGKSAAVSNRARVRRYYREHLRLERRKGLRLRAHHTSADVLRQIAPDTDPQAAARLREVYLRARYDEKGSITAQDVAEAKSAYKKLREDPRTR